MTKESVLRSLLLMFKFLKRQSNSRIILLGFLLTILIGSGLLLLPFCVKEGVHLSYIDSLYTSTSAVCVTGLVVVDVADTFTIFGQIIVALLIKIGGLGVTTLGAGIIIAFHKKMNLKGFSLISDSYNPSTKTGLKNLVKSIFFTTSAFELVGALLCLPSFLQGRNFFDGLWISIFHSIASFNNAGFDVLGNFQSLGAYSGDVLVNVVTCLLVFFGGIGFLVIKEIFAKKFNFKRYSMHSKIVLTTSFILIIFGTGLLLISDDVTFLEALFTSISARTAGFATAPISMLSKAGLLVIMILMFIGASPGSTGGGIKTSTLFVLAKSVHSSASGKREKAFKYSIPSKAIKKASVILTLSIAVVALGTLLVSLIEPDLAFVDVLFETVSAFGTVGLSTGITTTLTVFSKIIYIIIMFIGRLGPLTVYSAWTYASVERISYPEGNVSIG